MTIFIKIMLNKQKVIHDICSYSLQCFCGSGNQIDNIYFNRWPSKVTLQQLITIKFLLIFLPHTQCASRHMSSILEGSAIPNGHQNLSSPGSSGKQNLLSSASIPCHKPVTGQLLHFLPGFREEPN